MKKSLFFLCIFLSRLCVSAQVDTIEVYSQSMHRHIKTVLIKPASYKKHKQQRYPVVYLLHGYSGSYRDWPKKVPELSSYASLYNCMIVCPDGGYSSWYVNSPVDSTIRMETFVAAELPAFIDHRYRTLARSPYRAITGLSMGGHGAVMLAIKHRDVFGAASSISGALDLRDITHKYEASLAIGDPVQYAETWKKYSVLNLADTLPAGQLALLLDCGIEDNFIQSNRAVHAILLKRKVAHDYCERPGNHSWAYWTNALPYHLLFFQHFFERK